MKIARQKRKEGRETKTERQKDINTETQKDSKTERQKYINTETQKHLTTDRQKYTKSDDKQQDARKKEEHNDNYIETSVQRRRWPC